MKQIKITLQMCGIPGGPGGVKYRIEKLVNAVSVALCSHAVNKKFDVGSYLNETQVECLCERPDVEVTVLAIKD